MSVNIGYTGEVTIVSGSTYNKRFYNMGTDNLFRLLSLIFGRRDSYSNQDLPGKMMLYGEEREDVAESSVASLLGSQLLRAPVEINFYPEVVSEGRETIYQTVFTAYVDNKQLSTALIPTNVSLALLDGAGDSILAVVSVPDGENLLRNIANGNQTLIKWIMRFANAT